MFCSLKAALAVVASTFAIGWSDALLALKSATDPNMPFIMQCSG